MSETEEKKAVACPNCNQPAIKQGNEIACENCDAVFTFSKTGAKVKSVGKIDELDKRLTALEEKQNAQQPAPNQNESGEPEIDEDER